MATVEQTMMKVQRLLTGPMGLRIQLQGDRFNVQFSDMSTSLNIQVRDWGVDGDGEPETLVHLHALILREVPPSPQLFEWVAREGGRYWMGHVHAVDSEHQGKVDLWMTHTLLGDYLDEQELSHGMRGVLWTADQLDDELKGRFGGKRWVDE